MQPDIDKSVKIIVMRHSIRLDSDDDETWEDKDSRP